MTNPVLPWQPTTDRDFAGYREKEPNIRWPGDARLAVSVVVNIEEGAELSVGAGDEANEFIYEAAERVEGSRDLCMESHYEYGTRASGDWSSFWRIWRPHRASGSPGGRPSRGTGGRGWACPPGHHARRCPPSSHEAAEALT
jgi:hypothetical protein